MGSSPTLTQRDRRWDQDDGQTWDLAGVTSHRAQLAQQHAAEQAFDQLNPDFGVPADHTDPTGHQAVQEREAGLALGIRVAVAASRENDPTPVLTIPGQDYRAADAARAARLDLARHRQARHRQARQRTGAER